MRIDSLLSDVFFLKCIVGIVSERRYSVLDMLRIVFCLICGVELKMFIIF